MQVGGRGAGQALLGVEPADEGGDGIEAEAPQHRRGEGQRQQRGRGRGRHRRHAHAPHPRIAQPIPPGRERTVHREHAHRRRPRRRMVAMGRGELGEIAMPRPPPRRGEGTAERAGRSATPLAHQRLAILAGQVDADGHAIADGTEAAAPLGEVDGRDGHLDEAPPEGGRADQHLGLEDEASAARAHGVEQRRRDTRESPTACRDTAAPVSQSMKKPATRIAATRLAGRGTAAARCPIPAQTPADDERVRRLRRPPRAAAGCRRDRAGRRRPCVTTRSASRASASVEAAAERLALAAPPREPHDVGAGGAATSAARRRSSRRPRRARRRGARAPRTTSPMVAASL